MKHNPSLHQIMALTGVLFLLVGCTPFPEVTPSPDAEATPRVVASATPTSCAGWTCTLQGTVYVDAVRTGSELPGVPLRLSHVSYCSPTEGEHETVTGLDGRFHFNVYLHDTDTFWFDVEEEGYEPVRLSMGGFDCLFCICPPVEIVLQPQ
jgi:hypothetical protein